MARIFLPRTAITKDPPGLPRAPQAPNIFSSDPERNLGQPGITRPVAALPDERLIATLVSLGCPRQAAEQVRHHPSWRFAAVQVWCLVADAAEGRTVTNARTGESMPAREVVDMIRSQYEDARRAELIAEDPRRTVPGV